MASAARGSVVADARTTRRVSRGPSLRALPGDGWALVSIPSARQLSYRHRVDGTTYEVRGLSASDIESLLYPLHDRLLAALRSPEAAEAAELSSAHGMDCGFQAMYKGLCSLRLRGVCADGAALELFRLAARLDPGSLVFSLLGSEFQHLLAPPRAPVRRPKAVGIAALELDAHDELVRRSVLDCVRRCQEHARTSAPVGGYRLGSDVRGVSGSFMQHRKTMLVVSGATALRLVVDKQVMGAIDALMVVEPPTEAEGGGDAGAAEALKDVVPWCIELQGASTLRKPIFLDKGPVEEAERLGRLKSLYDVVGVLLFALPPGNDRTAVVRALRAWRGMCDRLLLVDFCQREERPVPPGLYKSSPPGSPTSPVRNPPRPPSQHHGPLDPSDVCRAVDNTEAILRSDNAQHSSGMPAAVLPWLLSEMGLQGTAEVDLSHAQWRDALHLAGFAKDSLSLVLPPAPPYSLFAISAAAPTAAQMKIV